MALELSVQTKELIQDENPVAGFAEMTRAGFTCADFSLNQYLLNLDIYKERLNPFFNQTVEELEAFFEPQRAAAEDFLNWWANSKEGQKFVVDTCALVPAFRTNTLEVKDPLGRSVKEYADAGELINNYNFLPDDHYSVLGADMQKYLAGVSTRKQLAKAIEKYWKTATPIAH